MTQIAHISDLHSNFHRLAKLGLSPDLWISTGDQFPDGPVSFQMDWGRQNAQMFQQIFGNQTVLVIDGNHDRADFGSLLRELGIDAVDVLETPQTIANLTFAGFRHIPHMGGYWEGEEFMPDLIDRYKKVLAAPLNLLITHAPPAGILDEGQFGIDGLANQIIYHSPIKAHLFGHTHLDGRQIQTINGIHFSNAACGFNILEL